MQFNALTWGRLLYFWAAIYKRKKERGVQIRTGYLLLLVAKAVNLKQQMWPTGCERRAGD